MTRLFVTRLAPTVTESILFELFSRYIDVRSAKIIRDYTTMESRGYGFVDLPHDEDLGTALELDGYQFHGKAIVVQPAKEKQ